MSKIIIAGVSGVGLNDEQRRALAGCTAIVASGRYRHLAEAAGCEVLPIAPVRDALAGIAARLAGQGSVGVLASGDPLFFGIARTLIDRFGPDQVEILPGVSSLQLACARFKIPWDDIRVVSLHGREADHLPGRLLTAPKVAVFTDNRLAPDRVANNLLRYLESVGAAGIIAGCRVLVAENLGQADERLVRGSLADISAQSFGNLNVMLLLRPAPAALISPLGLSEADISHSRGLITKDEVRAATLHRLGLPGIGVFWDVGAGSGSVSIEAARLCPGLHLFAVEKEEEQLLNIRKNITRFETFNVQPVAGLAPAVLAGLPDPDRVFIGGSGGRLAEIIGAAAGRLNEAGRIVVNCVTGRTRKEAPELLHRHGFSVLMSELKISRRQNGGNNQWIDLNPITIVTGIR